MPSPVDTLQAIALAGSLLVVLGFAVGTLYVLAVRVRDECDLHDVTVHAQELRLKQIRRQLMLDDDSDVVVADADQAAGSPDVAVVAEAA